MKKGCFKKNGKIHFPPDQDLHKGDKIYIRNLCAHEHFFNSNKKPVSILPEKGLFSPFFDLTFDHHNPPEKEY